MSDQHDGTYTAEVRSSTKPGAFQITATDGPISKAAKLTQKVGPVTKVALDLRPASITADGSSGTDATATVTDAHGNAVKGRRVVFSTDGNQQVGVTTDNGDGTYGAKITSTRKAGTSTVTATDSGHSGAATLTQTPGPVATVSVSLEPAVLAADGSARSRAMATALDEAGNPVPGRAVAISADGGQSVGPVSDNGDGTYTATITATTTPGTFSVLAADGSVTGSTKLTQSARSRPGPAEPASAAIVKLLVRHPSTLVRHNRTRVSLRCVGQAGSLCAGSLWLMPTDLTKRATGAAAPPAARFSVAGGKTTAVQVALSPPVQKRLHAYGRTVVWCVVRVKSGGRPGYVRRQLTLVEPRLKRRSTR